MTWADVERAMTFIDPISGVGFALLGIWMLTLQPRRAATTTLGLFAIGKGAATAIGGATTLLGLSREWILLVAPAWALATGALVALALRFPRPVQATERRSVVLASLGTCVIMALWLPVNLSTEGPRYAVLAAAPSAVSSVTVCGVLLFLALRYPGLDGPEERRGAITVSLALGAEIALRAGTSPFYTLARITTEGEVPFLVPATIGLVGAVLAVVALWLRNTGIAPPEARRAARNTALSLAALAFVGALLSAASPDPVRLRELGILGAARIAGVLLLAYAILRQQLFGLDVGVRWTLSRSTVAAAFVAVFFLVSEGAQLVLGDENPYLGLLGAGALVFAIAPLQRAAERLAERAVPVAAAVSAAPASSGKEDAYRAALRAALRDKRLSREEEVGLAHLSDELGLTHRRAREIWHEVEAEFSARGGAS